MLLVPALAAAAATLPAGSSITAVTVYSDGAEVTRNATINVAAPGTVEVLFDKLPIALLDKSVRVRGRDVTQGTVISVVNGDLKSVIARIGVKTPGPHNLSLIYAVPGAGWKPVYNAHVLLTEYGVQFDYLALVQQASGEDWPSVDLTLSSLKVDGSRSLERTGAGLGPVYVHPSPLDSGPPHAPAVSHRVSGTSSIRGDNSPTKVPVATTRLPFVSETVVLPQSSDTIRTLHVTNSFEFPLLAGTLNWLLGDRRLTTEETRTIIPGTVFTFVLRDKIFPTTRKLINRYEDDGPLNKTWRINYELMFTVKNPLPTVESIRLVDGVPKPGIYGRHKEIVVTVITPAPKGPPLKASGRLEWNLTLAPGETRELPAKFSIEFLDMPIRKGKVIIGDLKVVDELLSEPETKR